MKTKLRLLILLLAASTMMGQAFAQKGKNMYQTKSGIIEFKLTGKITGTETMYFDDHGKKEATFRNLQAR